MSIVDGALQRKLERFVQLNREEVVGLVGLQSRRRSISAHTEIVREREEGARAFIVLSGWACAYKLLPDGGRQVIDFPVAGDFMGVRSVLLRASDHSFAAITDLVVAEITARRIMDVLQTLPRLGCAILWAASRDEAMVVEHLVGVGRRSALARTAHLFVELSMRLQLIGLADDAGFACPLNQNVLADALGLTSVHINRVLRQLRERGVMTLRDGRATVHDLAGLKQLAGYHSGYLDQNGPLPS